MWSSFLQPQNVRALTSGMSEGVGPRVLLEGKGAGCGEVFHLPVVGWRFPTTIPKLNFGCYLSTTVEYVNCWERFKGSSLPL